MDKILGTDRQTVTLGGEGYTLSPLTLGMMADFCRYFKAAPIREFMLLSKETELPEAFKMAQLAQLYKEQRLDKRTDDQVLNEGLKAAGGVFYMIYLMLKKDAPTLTYGTFLEFPSTEIEDVLPVLSLLGLDVEEKENGAEKKTASEEPSPERATV